MSCGLVWDDIEPELWELDEIESEDLTDPDEDTEPEPKPDIYSSDERFGTDRQAKREYDRDMITKWEPGAMLKIDWSEAKCVGEDPEWWFIDAPHKPTNPDHPDRAKAKALCAECPLRLRCLEFACVSKEAYGIWGGHGREVRCNNRDSEHANHDYQYLKTLPIVGITHSEEKAA